jgi:ribosome maturation factor RimP
MAGIIILRVSSIQQCKVRSCIVRVGGYPLFISFHEIYFKKFHYCLGGILLPKENLRELVFNLAEPIIQKNGMELVDVEFVKEGANWYLRVYLDKDTGIELDDCEKISRIISELLDREDPIAQAYFLEVSSPGLDRPLKKEKDFHKHFGQKVVVNTYSSFDGKKQHQGKLGLYNQNNLKLTVENGREIEIPWNIISQVKLDWEN